jgi:hypothetical protein
MDTQVLVVSGGVAGGAVARDRGCFLRCGLSHGDDGKEVRARVQGSAGHHLHSLDGSVDESDNGKPESAVVNTSTTPHASGLAACVNIAERL